jgi:CspA family cold shock protein
MTRDYDWRPPQRRGFDDDDFVPQSRRRGYGGATPSFATTRLPLMSGPAVGAVVKWFNAEKGFGFAAVSDGSGDAFLPAGVLARAGHEDISPGATLQVRIAPGHKGPQITEILEIDVSTASEPGPSAARSPRQASAAVNPEVLRGTVKWFNQMKGYGFIAPDEGGPDVFVHVSAVERSGLPTLREGQVLEYQTQLQRNGKSAAVNLRLT